MKEEVESLVSRVKTFIGCIEDNPYITDQIPQELIKYWSTKIKERIGKVEEQLNQNKDE